VCLTVTKLVLSSSRSLRGQGRASVEALYAVLRCAGGVCPAVVIQVAFQTAYQTNPATMHTVFMSLCVPDQEVGFGGTAVQPFFRKFLSPPAAKEFQIGLYGHADAGLELFCNSWSAGVLGERLSDVASQARVPS